MVQTIEEQEQELQRQKQLIQEYETSAEKYKNQIVPERRFGSGVTKQVQQAVVLQKQEATSYLSNLNESKQKILQGEQQIQEYKENKSAFEEAEKLAYKGAIEGNVNAVRSAYFNLKRKGYSEAFKYYTKLYNYYKGKTKEKPIQDTYIVNPKYNYTPADFLPEDYYIVQNYSPAEKPKSDFGYSYEDYVVIKGEIGKPDYLNKVGGEVYYDINMSKEPKQFNFNNYNIKGVEAGKIVYEKKLFSKELASENAFGEYLSITGNILKSYGTDLYTGTKQFITAPLKEKDKEEQEFRKSLIKTPFKKLAYDLSKLSREQKTVLSTVGIVGFSAVPYSSIPLASYFSYQTGKAGVKTYANPTPQNFAETTVKALAVAPFLPKAIVRTSDVVRTIRLNKVENEIVIAPETFAGQKYPTIKKGQTAGELLEEFKPILKGETKPAGFTASPTELKGLQIGGSSSELQGLYQSPKLNPTFLKIAGEKKIFSFNIFETFKPTALRITPTEFKLLSGLNKNQKSIVPLGTAKARFIEEQPLGQSVIPFLKTEKEAVIPKGTYLDEFQSRFYFKFEGRRIPIREAKTIKVENVIKNINKEKITIEEAYYSYSLKMNKSLYNPASIGYLFSSSYTPKSYSSSTSASSVSSALKSYNSISKSNSKSYNSISKGTVSYGGISAGALKSGNYNYPTQSFTTGDITTGTKKIAGIRFRNYPKGNKLVDAYRTYIISSGKKKYISGIREKGEAIRIGEKKTLESLRATFGVEKLRRKIKANETTYKPSSKAFRDYRILNGKKIKLNDIFIQRKGTRLGRRGEVSEIMRARRLKA